MSDFELPDQSGLTCRLSDQLHPHGAVLIFYRGHWCPYCRRYLSKIQANLGRFREFGVGLVAISPEPVSTAAALARELQLTFPLLSDSDGRVIDRFGVRNGFLGGSSGLPHPAVWIIDSEGGVVFRSIDRNYKKRTTVPTILSALRSMALPIPTAVPAEMPSRPIWSPSAS